MLKFEVEKIGIRYERKKKEL